jgi:hypothetical protein
MRKESQRQLVEEGFGDIVRGAARAFMTSKLGQAIKSDLQPFSDMASAFRGQQPKQVLKDALKTEYYNTFNLNTVKIGKEKKLQGDSAGNSRVAIEFTAKRIRGVNVPNAPGELEGGEGNTDTAKKGEAEQYTAILTRTKKGSSGDYTLEIRDSSNRIIRGTKDKKQREKVSWGEEFADADWPNPSNISVSDLAAWIEDAAGSALTKPRRIALARAFGATTSGSPSIEDILTDPATSARLSISPPLSSTSVLTQPQIQEIKNIFIQQRVFVESVVVIKRETKNNKPTQLQLLESSYNLRYELPINKGN